ncbi:MAG: transglycosylase SLT domain-containing protein [Candidatus Parcubacteria bacterium]|nr:transglycosylase SLT domain-containing protein [Candidatus Parcubacteria bacterium]
MKITTIPLQKFIANISRIAEKSAILMLTLALIWQCFPRITSLAQTIEPNTLSTVQVAVSQQSLSVEDQIITLITKISEEENFKNPGLVIAIARAESRFNPKIRGESDKRDRGLYQINSHFNAEVTDECAFDPECATRWTIKELEAGHAWKWNASKSGWGRYQ